MDQTVIQTRHLAELGFLEDILNKMGYATQLVEKSRQVPYHALLVALDPDAKDRPRQMILTFYPVGEEEVENTLFLQYFIELPFALGKRGLARVREFLPSINNKVVVGHFGIAEGQNRLHYRYVQALPDDEIVTKEAVADVIVLVSYTPLLFGDILYELAQGTISTAQAKTKVEAKYAET